MLYQSWSFVNQKNSPHIYKNNGGKRKGEILWTTVYIIQLKKHETHIKLWCIYKSNIEHEDGK